MTANVALTQKDPTSVSTPANSDTKLIPTTRWDPVPTSTNVLSPATTALWLKSMVILTNPLRILTSRLCANRCINTPGSYLCEQLRPILQTVSVPTSTTTSTTTAATKTATTTTTSPSTTTTTVPTTRTGRHHQTSSGSCPSGFRREVVTGRCKGLPIQLK